MIMDNEIKSVDEVIEDIVEVLIGADGEFIQNIANQVIPARVKYLKNDLFKLEYYDEAK